MKDKLKDVVCGMEVDATGFAHDYLGTHYAFCSAQCRERFLMHPHLFIGLPGQPAPKQEGRNVLKRRNFELHVRPLDADQARIVEERVHALMGVKAVEMHATRVTVTYDLLQVTAEQIESELAAAGAELGNGWAARLGRGLIHYSEECEVGHLQVAPGPGCH